jgi:capsular polysaccharide biosynthesis protein
VAAPDPDWLRAEQPTRLAFVSELRRLARRARSRWIVIVLVAAVLTGGVLWRRSKKIKIHDAEVTLAVTEGSLASRYSPAPVGELRNYILTVLLSDEVLAAEIAELGLDMEVIELRDMFNVHVWRNFFLYAYSVDAPRSARIAIEVFDPDANFAYELANRLALLVIERETERRIDMAQHIAAEASSALDAVNRRVAGLEAQSVEISVELAAARDRGDRGTAAALQVELGELTARLHREHDAVVSLTQQANADQLAEAIDRAGLGLEFVIADSTGVPVEEPGASLYFRVIVGVALFFVILPLVGLFVGAFDPRVHDEEDVERLGLPILGHVPGFAGDGVGSLRDRGVRGRRVPS